MKFKIEYYINTPNVKIEYIYIWEDKNILDAERHFINFCKISNPEMAGKTIITKISKVN